MPDALTIATEELKTSLRLSISNVEELRKQWFRFFDIYTTTLFPSLSPLSPSPNIQEYILTSLGLSYDEVEYLIRSCYRPSYDNLKNDIRKLVVYLLKAFGLHGWWELYFWTGKEIVESRRSLLLIQKIVKRYDEMSIEDLHAALDVARKKRKIGRGMKKNLNIFALGDVSQTYDDLCSIRRLVGEDRDDGGGVIDEGAKGEGKGMEKDGKRDDDKFKLNDSPSGGIDRAAGNGDDSDLENGIDDIQEQDGINDMRGKRDDRVDSENSKLDNDFVVEIDDKAKEIGGMEMEKREKSEWESDNNDSSPIHSSISGIEDMEDADVSRDLLIEENDFIPNDYDGKFDLFSSFISLTISRFQ